MMKCQTSDILGRNVFSTWVCFLLLLAHSMCCIRLGSLTQTVFAAGNGNPSTVRPLSTKRRLPFLSSINPRQAAKEAYLLHLKSELESAQRQLYVSQNTCTSLRKRWEDQRMETLASMTTRSHDANAVLEKQDEIDRLQHQLQLETEKYEQQVERFNLLSSEMDKLKAWKETQEQSNQGKLLQYEQLLEESNRRQNDYAEQVQMLALKLEAAAFAAKARRLGEGEGGRGESNTTYALRAKELRSELESIRAHYSMMLSKSLQESVDQGFEGENEQQKQRESEMDNAIQSAFESAIDSFEKEWAARFETLENQLKNITAYATTVEAERDAALNSQVQTSISSNVEQSDQKQTSSSLSVSQSEQLRHDLTAELTDTLTIELTEQLTKQLTKTLVDNVEKTYKKKIKQLHTKIKEQRKIVSELKQSQEMMNLEKQQTLESEIVKIKHQYELDYESKLHQLQAESEEQKRVQTERMRKLVRALLERESLQKERKSRTEDELEPIAIKKGKSSSKKKKMKDNAAGDGSTKDGDSDPNEVVPATLSSSRKRSAPGIVPPVRGNR